MELEFVKRSWLYWLCSLGVLPSIALSQGNVSLLFKRTDPSVVLLTTFTASGEELKLGTGFFVNDGTLIVTNDHVIEGAKQVIAKLANGALVPIHSTLARDSVRDLAILVSPTRGIPLPLSLRPPDIGESVLTIGNPQGFEHTVSTGIISGIRGDDFYQITAPISPGSSGGPVIDSKGAAIGVVTWTRRESQNLNFAVPIQYVARLLRSPVTPISASGSTNGPAPTRIAGGSEAPGMPSLSEELGIDPVSLSVEKIRGDCCGQSGLEVTVENRTNCPITNIRFQARFKSGPWKDDPVVAVSEEVVNAVLPPAAKRTSFIPLVAVEGHGNGDSDPLQSRWWVQVKVISFAGCSK